MTLIDNRGVGKRDKYTGKDHESFLQWKTKLESFIYSIFLELEKVLTWAEDQDSIVTMDWARAAFGIGTAEPVGDLDEKSFQVKRSIAEFTWGRTFHDSTKYRKGKRLWRLYESWRRLNRRYGPSTGAKKSSLLRHILSPGRCKLEELSERIEGWMELVSRYEFRKSRTGTRQAFADDIKMSILEGMCPAEAERHLQLNRSKSLDFDDMHSELAISLETCVGVKLKMESLGSSKCGEGDMEIGAFGKVVKVKVKEVRVKEKEIKEKVKVKACQRMKKVPITSLAQVRQPWFVSIVASRDTCSETAEHQKRTTAAATRAKEKEETKVRTRVSTTWKKTTNKTWSRNRIPRVSHVGCHFGRPRKDFERYVCGEPHTTKYKTASGELLEDHGQVKL